MSETIFLALTEDDEQISLSLIEARNGSDGADGADGADATAADINDGDLSIAKTSGLQTALDGKAAVSHTHVSADITDATSVATANTIVKRTALGSAFFATTTGTALNATATTTGDGLFVNSGSGTAIVATSTTGELINLGGGKFLVGNDGDTTLAGSLNVDATGGAGAAAALNADTGTALLAESVSGNHANFGSGKFVIANNGDVTATGGLIVGGDINGNLVGNAVTATALATGRTLAITGDLAWTSPSFTGSGNVTAAGTLATVNASPGTFGSATTSLTATVNAKGLITALSSQTVTPAVGSITGFGGGVATWLATPTTLPSGTTGSSLTSVGTINTGVWQGTAIGDTYISSAATWNAKQSALTFSTGLTNTAGSVTVNAAQTQITSVGTLTGGGTGAGFTIALTTSTVTGNLPVANTPAFTGDVTKSAGSGATTIAAGVVTNAMLAGSIDATTKFTGATPIANGGTGAITQLGALQNLGMVDGSTIIQREEFMGGSTASSIGELGWYQNNSISGTGSFNTAASEATEWGQYIVTSGASAGNASALFLGHYNHANSISLNTVTNWEYRFRFKLGSTANMRARVGLNNDYTGIETSSGIWVRYDTNATYGDTNFKFVCRAASTSTVVDSTIAADTSWHMVRIRSTSAGTVLFQLYDSTGATQGSEQSIATNVPSAGLWPTFIAGTDTTAAKSVTCGFYSLLRTGIAR